MTNTTQKIIKAAVQAIEDVFGGLHRPQHEKCCHDCPQWDECACCVVEHLKPHLEALKGLLND